MRYKVILHIGLQKTATSALQAFFCANRRQLEYDGFTYLHPSEYGHGDFPTPSFHNCIAGTIGDFPSNFSKLSDASLRHLKRIIDTEDRPILISGEEFSRTRDVGRIYDFFGEHTLIVMYLREQSDWAQSMYNQRNKILFTRCDERLFYEDMLTPSDLFQFLKKEGSSRILRFDRLTQAWSEAFGRENVIVRPFAPESFSNKSIAGDFLSILGIDDLSAYNEVPRVNESISNEWINIIREFAVKAGQDSAVLLLKQLVEYANAGKINLSGATKLLPNPT